MYAKKIIALVAMITFGAKNLFAIFPGIDVFSTSQEYQKVTTENKCLIDEQSFEKAWQHRKGLNHIISIAEDLGLKAEADAKVSINNSDGRWVGYHWGYSPVLAAELYKLLEENSEVHLLAVGSGIGLDASVLVKNFPKLTVTAIDQEPLYKNIASDIADQYLDKSERARLTFVKGTFPQNIDNDAEYDIVVAAKVIQRYNDTHIESLLQSAHDHLKPGGFMLQENASAKCCGLIDWLTSYFGNYIPAKITSTAWFGLGFVNFISTDQMRGLAESAGFDVTQNTYIGSPWVNRIKAYSWTWAYPKEVMLYTKLQKPEE